MSTRSAPQTTGPWRIVDGLLQTLTVLVGVAGAIVVAAAFARFLPGTNAVERADGDTVIAAPTTTLPSTTVAPAADGTTTTTAAEPTTVPSTTLPTDTTLPAPDTTVPPPPEPVLDVLGTQLETITYRVERDDTLGLIAARFGVDWREIAELNDLTDPNVLGIGTVLLIPDQEPLDPTVPAVLAENPERLELLPSMDQWAATHGVPPELLKAVLWQESQWDGALVSATGEVGIAQLRPELYGWISSNLIGEPLDPADDDEGIRLAAAYLGWLLEQTDGDTSAALASYHQGLRSQRDIGWRRDTVQYISSVLALRPIFDARAGSGV